MSSFIFMLQSYLSTALTKLQLYVQKVSASLEDSGQNVLLNMPKILRDTQLLQQEAQSLKEKMQIVKLDFENVQSQQNLQLGICQQVVIIVY